MTRFRLSRRSLLRGTAGIGLALPALEIMMPASARGQAMTIPNRFVLSYGGSSLAGSRAVNHFVPDTVGPNYDVKRALKSLTDLGVRDQVSIVSGLTIPWDTGSGVPPGGRTVQFHFNTIAPQVAGTKSYAGASGPTSPTQPSADQKVASVIKGTTRFPVLAYRVQPAMYLGSNSLSGSEGQLSWKQSGSSVIGVDPFLTPRLAYESLVAGLTPPDPAAQQRALFLLRQNKSVLDLVAQDTQALAARVGTADRRTLEQYLEGVRAIEKNLEAVNPTVSACKVPTAPKTSWPVDVALGYSEEDLRGDVLTDLIAMAFACDQSRVSSLLITSWKTWMNAYPVTGVQSDMHALSHGGGGSANSNDNGFADGLGWMVKQFARLVAKLKAIPEVDGSTVLDHTAMVQIFEGGNGGSRVDLEEPSAGNPNPAHSTENMAVLVAGGAGKLKRGVHLRTPGKHPAQVIVSAMQAVGVNTNLGDISANIPELFGP